MNTEMIEDVLDGQHIRLIEANHGFYLHCRPAGKAHRATSLTFKLGRKRVDFNSRQVKALKAILGV